METLYLDNNATTRVAPEVLEAMRPHLSDAYGNPSSLHRMGQAAHHAIEQAREKLAAFVHADHREIIFTSGGTESDNLAILGTLAAYPKKKHVIITAVEHPAVLSACERLEKQNVRITYVGVDRLGQPDVHAFERAFDDETALASVMYANNETGVIHPIEEMARIAAKRGVVFHVDAVQALAKIPIDLRRLPVSLMSFSAHKIHGPKGVGALFVRKGVRLRSSQIGGHQERDLRPGTENVPGIVGLGAAAELAARDDDSVLARITALRDRLEGGILSRFEWASVNGDREHRTANTTNIGFAGLEAEAILIALSEAGICASSGSACSSGSLEPSHVLKAMAIDERIAHGAIRFSLSRYTTAEEIDETLARLPTILERLIALAPALS